jgi:hypothetical protein
MSTSNKHHYLPEFYLKGFVNEAGQFSIFDYKKNSIKKGEYFPSTHFFEKGRNLLNLKGEKTDFIEQIYSIKDERYSKLLKLIQSSDSAPNLDSIQLLTLQDFVSNLFWRIPKNDTLYEEQFKENPLISKAYKIVDAETKEELHDQITEKIKTSKEFKKGLRVTASDFLHMAHNTDDLHNWRIGYSTSSLHLCSDNPLILKNEIAKDIFKTEFIFPLTKNHLLFRSFNNLKIKVLPAEYSLMIDLIIFKQGELFCASSRKDYLTTMSTIACNYDIARLKNKVFNYLDKSTSG